MQYLKYMALFAENRKARFEFEILETLEAGLELFGFEVKAVRNHKMSLEGSYVFPKRGDFYLVGATIAPYQPKNTPKDYEQARERRLLVPKKHDRRERIKEREDKRKIERTLKEL